MFMQPDEQLERAGWLVLCMCSHLLYLRMKKQMVLLSVCIFVWKKSKHHRCKIHIWFHTAHAYEPGSGFVMIEAGLEPDINSRSSRVRWILGQEPALFSVTTFQIHLPWTLLMLNLERACHDSLAILKNNYQIIAIARCHAKHLLSKKCFDQAPWSSFSSKNETTQQC